MVLVDIGIVLVLTAAVTGMKLVFFGAGALLERAPLSGMILIAAWALYAGYTPIRWTWVVVSFGLAVEWAVFVVTGGEQNAWFAGPMAVGYGFVGLTLALSSSVRRFLAARRAIRETDGLFDPAYTATLAFLGCFYLWGLGGLRVLGWGSDDLFLTILAVVTLGGLGLLYLAVSALRLAGLPLAGPVTTVVSFFLAVQFPFGTAVFIYWLLKVREHERTALVERPPARGKVAQSMEPTSDSPTDPEGR